MGTRESPLCFQSKLCPLTSSCILRARRSRCPAPTELNRGARISKLRYGCGGRRSPQRPATATARLAAATISIWTTSESAPGRGLQTISTVFIPILILIFVLFFFLLLLLVFFLSRLPDPPYTS